MTDDDDPIDLLKVGADDAAIEGLRSGRDANDPVLLLLRDLLDDVDAQEVPVPVGCGSTVLTLAGDRSPERRTVRRGALVAAVTAGLLSVSGVAAATTMAPTGTALHGLGEVVRSAVGAAVGSVTPPDPVVVPASSATPSSAPSPASVAAAPPGAEVSAAARSTAAARQVAALLDAAEELLRDGRTEAASARLDTAEKRLSDVAAAERAPLAERLAVLREQVAAAAPAAPAAEPAGKPAAPPKKEQPARETAPKADPPKPAEPGPQDKQPAEPKKEQPRVEREPAGKEAAAPRASARTEKPTAPQAPTVDVERPQVSKDASTKPRA